MPNDVVGGVQGSRVKAQVHIPDPGVPGRRAGGSTALPDFSAGDIGPLHSLTTAAVRPTFDGLHHAIGRAGRDSNGGAELKFSVVALRVAVRRGVVVSGVQHLAGVVKGLACA